MTLSDQQRSNREKFHDFPKAWVNTEDVQLKNADVYPFLNTLTEETWKNSGEAMLGRVRAEWWPGYACVLGTVRYSPIFDRKEDAENYEHRPKGTEVVKVVSMPAALKELTSERTMP